MTNKRLCRLCLKNENRKRFIEIFSKNNKIVLQVFSLTGIKIEAPKNIPALICDECLKSLSAADDFRLRCLESNKYFHEVSAASFDEEETNVLLQESFLEKVTKDEVIDKVESIIDEETIEKPKRNSSSKLSIKNVSTPSSLTVTSKTRNLRKKTNVTLRNLLKKEKSNTRYRPMCTFCGKEQESEYRLIQHELLAHTPLHRMSLDDVFVCDLCARIFKTKQSMRNHFIRAHTPSTDKFPCSVCGKVLPHLKALYAHERVHIKSEVTCQYCGKTFDRKVLLSSHIAIVHLKKRISQCEFCPHQAITGGALKKHIRCKHLNLREHHCDWPDCGKSFHENQHLVRHFRSHTQERPFECRHEGCEKAFSDHAKRSRHEKQNCPRKMIV